VRSDLPLRPTGRFNLCKKPYKYDAMDIGKRSRLRMRPPPGRRLKALQLQAYKPLLPHRVLFDSGITAVVGPNGSGKSNIADAIRWVLGEQSFRTLRGKRTEDMILPVAPNALGTAWLRCHSSWTTPMAGAHRLLRSDYHPPRLTAPARTSTCWNDSRVRLRDITDCWPNQGWPSVSYTVIGQGVVDAVLSLRPEDRVPCSRRCPAFPCTRTSAPKLWRAWTKPAATCACQ